MAPGVPIRSSDDPVKLCKEMVGPLSAGFRLVSLSTHPQETIHPHVLDPLDASRFLARMHPSLRKWFGEPQMNKVCSEALETSYADLMADRPGVSREATVLL